MQQWEQFEHNSAPRAGSCSLNSFLPTCTPQRDGEGCPGGKRSQKARSLCEDARLRPWHQSSEQLQLGNGATGAWLCWRQWGQEVKAFSGGVIAAVWLLLLSAAGIRGEK